MRLIMASVTRRLLAFVLVLGLAPGVSGGLFSLGGAHCSHACCKGQDFCERGGGHQHSADDETSSHHGAHAHEPVADSFIASVEPPSESCREICGVLAQARTHTIGATRHKALEDIPTRLSAPPPVIVADETSELESPAAPRGPPPEKSQHL